MSAVRAPSPSPLLPDEGDNEETAPVCLDAASLRSGPAEVSPFATEARKDRRTSGWAKRVVVLALAGLALAWSGWLMTGGSLFWVGSPSMGTVAPVGSLVATRPLAANTTLRVGQIVVFAPYPGRSLVYVHRIDQILPDGRYVTKGDLNQVADPWAITRNEIIGTPQAIIPAIGWIFKCATWICLGSAVLVGIALALPERRRTWLLALGPTALLAVPLLVYRPMIGGFIYGSGHHSRIESAAMVDTGVLPVYFTPAHGHAVYAAPGQEVIVKGIVPAHAAALVIRISAALPWWGWAAVVALCLAPLLAIRSSTPRARRTSPAPPASVSGTQVAASSGRPSDEERKETRTAAARSGRVA